MTILPTPADAGLIVPGSIGAHALAWVTTLRASGRSPSTIRARTRALRDLFTVVPAHTPARDVGAAHLAAWLIRMREKPGPAGRVRAVNSALQVEDAARMLWNWLARQELIASNPFRRIPRGRPAAGLWAHRSHR
jgi:site-specific recombinase XerD